LEAFRCSLSPFSIRKTPAQNTNPEWQPWKTNSALLPPVNKAIQKKGQKSPNSAIEKPGLADDGSLRSLTTCHKWV